MNHNRVFGIDEKCVRAIADLSERDLIILKRLEKKAVISEKELMNKILSTLKRERWADWMEGTTVSVWLKQLQEKTMFSQIVSEFVQNSSLNMENAVDILWLSICWLEKAINSLVFIPIAPKAFGKTPIKVYRDGFPCVKQFLIEKACDRSWQERTVLENYLGGLEAKLMEAEVQEVLLR